MSDDWQAHALGDVIELKRGYDLPQQNRSRGKVPLVSSSGVTDYHSTAMVKGPGVVTGRYGTLGQVFYVEQDFWPLNTTLYVRDFKGNDPRFISYFLRGLDFLAYSDKAAVPGLNRNHLHLAEVRFPSDLNEQRRIARILGALDDKIELNRRMNETLEAMARALFKSWFVDFDPVRAKAEGRAPGLPESLSKLFPDRLVDSELGEVPDEWKINRLGDLFELAYGKALRAEDRHGGAVPVYGSNGQVGSHDESLAAGPGIVIGRKGNPGTVTWANTDFFVIDTAFYMVPSTKRHCLHFLFRALQTHDLASLAADSAVPGLNRNFVYANLQVVPPAPLLTQFEASARTLAERAHQSDAETAIIATLRDALLPKLISGEIRVKDAERIVAEAAA
jgi:type I restriction enzyme S subunit